MLGQREGFRRLQLGGECSAACQPGGTFEAMAAITRDLHAVHGQFDAQRSTLLLAVAHPIIGSGLQTVVYMHGTQWRASGLRRSPQPVQQHG
ncbi:hypothetical protein D3C81_1479520 [compost metagenome]